MDNGQRTLNTPDQVNKATQPDLSTLTSPPFPVQSPRHSWLSSTLRVWPLYLMILGLFAPPVVVSLPRLPLGVARTRTAINVVGTKNTMPDVGKAAAETIVVTTRIEMMSDDVTRAVAVTATCLMTKIVVRAAIAAKATVIMTVEMKMQRSAIQGECGLSEMIALRSGHHPQPPGLPLGAQVLDTMTTPEEFPPHRHYPTMTNPGGQTHRPRMPPPGVNRKTCTEGTAGGTEGVTISNGKWPYVSAYQYPS